MILAKKTSSKMFDWVLKTPLESLRTKTLREKCPYWELSGPYFPAFGLNTESPSAGKYRPE